MKIDLTKTRVFHFYELKILLELLSNAINWTYFIFISSGINFSSTNSVFCYLTNSSGKERYSLHFKSVDGRRIFRFVIRSSFISVVNLFVFMKLEYCCQGKKLACEKKYGRKKSMDIIIVIKHGRYRHLCGWKIVGHENSCGVVEMIFKFVWMNFFLCQRKISYFHCFEKLSVYNASRFMEKKTNEEKKMVQRWYERKKRHEIFFIL